MELVGAFVPSDSLTCLDTIMDNEYDASFSIRRMCFFRVQMWLSVWAHTDREVCNFPLLNFICHLFLLPLTL